MGTNRLERENRIRLEELDSAKDYLNSDYYWKRRRELTEEHSEAYYDTDRNKPSSDDWNENVRV